MNRIRNIIAEQGRKTIFFQLFFFALYMVLLKLLLFDFCFSFNYQLALVNQYYLLVIGICAFIISTIMAIFNKSHRSFFYLYYIICICSIASFDKINGFGFGNEKFTSYLALILALLPVLIFQSDFFIKVVWVLILLFFNLQTILIIIQFAKGETLVGSYNNTGVASCYLVLHVPLAYYFFLIKGPQELKFKNNFLPWALFSISYLLVLMVALVNQSRTALMALFLLTLVFLIRKTKGWLLILWGKSGWNKFWMLTSLALGVIFIICAVAYFKMAKQASFDGRLLIWEIGWKNISKNPWFGQGFGRISYHYPQWQSEYFFNQSTPATVSFLCAGESYILFNDFLELLLETGLIGCSIFFMLMVYIFTIQIKDKRWADMLKSTLFALLVTGFSAYPLETNASVLIFFLCIISLLSARGISYISLKQKWLTFLLLSIGMFLSLPVLYKAGKKSKALIEMTRLTTNDKKLSTTRAFSLNISNFPDDGKLLARYGLLLKHKGELDSAIYYLEKSKKYLISYHSMESLAQCYLRVNNYNEAIQHYVFLSNYIPNKLMPRYMLFQIYLNGIRDTVMAEKYARDILSMPIKIPSLHVDVIKKDIKAEMERAGLTNH